MSDLFAPLPDKKYDIIYADPPWRFSGTMSSKSVPENHYPTVKTKDLMELDVPSICAENCLLYMWVINSHLKQGIELGEKWNFKYSTCPFVWNKIRPVVGHYTMMTVELVLVFKKGKYPLPKGTQNERQFLEERSTKHSAKPLEIRERISRMHPTQKKIELFARSSSCKEWDTWGNQSGENVAEQEPNEFFQ